MGSHVENQILSAAAFFDLDKTVIARSSALAFGRPFYDEGLIGRADMLRGAYAHLVFRLAGASPEQMQRMRAYVSRLCRGWPVEQVRQIIDDTLHDLLGAHIYAEAASLIADHRARGHDIVIVSSSGREMVEPIGALLDADHVIATRMAEQDGRYTGEIEFYAYGESKAEAIRGLAARRGYDLSASYAYSDSITDLPMLEAVGHPYAVNPDRALRKAAASREWPVLVFHRAVPLRGRLRHRPVVAATATATVVAAAAGLYWYANRRRDGAGLGPPRRPAPGARACAVR